MADSIPAAPSADLVDADERLLTLMEGLQERAYPKGQEPPDLELRLTLALIERMLTTLSDSAKMFDEYGRHHRAKLDGRATIVERQLAYAKALRNEAAATACRAAMFTYPDVPAAE